MISLKASCKHYITHAHVSLFVSNRFVPFISFEREKHSFSFLPSMLFLLCFFNFSFSIVFTVIMKKMMMMIVILLLLIQHRNSLCQLCSHASLNFSDYHDIKKRRDWKRDDDDPQKESNVCLFRVLFLSIISICTFISPSSILYDDSSVMLPFLLKFSVYWLFEVWSKSSKSSKRKSSQNWRKRRDVLQNKGLQN